MAIKLNLLPPEHAANAPLGRLIKLARMLNVILLSGFLIFGLGLGGFYVFNNINLQSLNGTNNNLKAQITAQETSEQQVVLLKDRIDKIQTVQQITSAAKNFSNVSSLVSAIGSNSSLSELDVDSQKTDLSVLFKSNSDLTSFIKNISGSKLFTTVALTTFGYNPANGYLSTFHIL